MPTNYLQTRPWGERYPRVCARLVVAASVAFLSACAAPPSGPLAGNDPADPARPVPAVALENYMELYIGRRPVEPLSWREQNERVAPGRRP